MMSRKSRGKNNPIPNISQHFFRIFKSNISFFLSVLMLLAAILGCSFGVPTTSNQEDALEEATLLPTKFESADNPASESTLVLVPDIKIDPLLNSDEVLFFASTDFEYRMGHMAEQLLSADLDNNQLTCLTCSIIDNGLASGISIRFPATLSPDKDNIFVNTNLLNQEGNHTEQFNQINLRNGTMDFIGREFYLSVPAWSPDGTKIAGLGQEFIEVIDSSSGQLVYDSLEILNVRQSWSPSCIVSWAPDSKRLVFDDDLEHIVILDSEQDTITIPPIELKSKLGGIYTFTNWSPDGQLIAFVSDMEGRSTGIRYDEVFEMKTGGADTFSFIDLFVLDPNDYSISCLTCNLENSPQFVMHPVWSLNSKQIAFFSRNLSGLPNASDDLYTINSDGSNLNLLVSFPSVYTFRSGYYSRFGGPPQWTKDGKQLVFSALKDGRTAIFTINADGSDLRLVAADPNQDFINPEWVIR